MIVACGNFCHHWHANSICARVGNVGYFQAQMSRDGDGKTLYLDDVEAHTDQCCRNLDAMMQSVSRLSRIVDKLVSSRVLSA